MYISSSLPHSYITATPLGDSLQRTAFGNRSHDAGCNNKIPSEFFERLVGSFCPFLANIFPLMDLTVTFECKICNAEPSSLEVCATRPRSTTEAAQELNVGV
jgi:hypothetical protein